MTKKPIVKSINLNENKKNSLNRIKINEEEVEKGEEECSLKYSPHHAIHILAPVSICMLITILSVMITKKASFNNTYVREHLLDDEGFKENFTITKKDSNISSTQTIYLSIVYIFIIIISTSVILLFVYLNKMKVFIIFMASTITILVFMVSLLFWLTIAIVMDSSTDVITSFFLIINSTALALVCILWNGPKQLTQFFHIYLSFLTTWYLDNLTSLWLGWLMLVILSIWDLIAVLPKYGPLNLILKILSKRGQQIPNALIYSIYFEWPALIRAFDKFQTTNNKNELTNGLIEIELDTFESSHVNPSFTSLKVNKSFEYSKLNKNDLSEKIPTLNINNNNENISSVVSGNSRSQNNESTSIKVQLDDDAKLKQNDEIKNQATNESVNNLQNIQTVDETEKENFDEIIEKSNQEKKTPTNSANKKNKKFLRNKKQQKNVKRLSLTINELKQIGRDDQEDGPKLGIGDFVFYSLLIAKSATQLNATTIIACFLTIIIGLTITMLLVAILRRPLPALPISIFLSTILFFASEFTIVPFCNRLSLNQIFI